MSKINLGRDYNDIFLVEKKVSTIAKWNTSLKLTPVPWVLLFSPDGMIIRTKFTCNSSELHDTSLALTDIPEWREGLWREGRVGGERHSFYMWDYSKCLSKDLAMARAQTF